MTQHEFRWLEMRARALSCLAAFLQQTVPGVLRETQFFINRYAQDRYLSFRHERRAIT